jgi:hypothetical protein
MTLPPNRIAGCPQRMHWRGDRAVLGQGVSRHSACGATLGSITRTTARRMTRSTTRSRQHPGQHLATQLGELAVAAPQVVAQRWLRWAAAGAQPSEHDRREMRLMGDEKLQAFQQSWVAMWTQAWHSHAALTQGMITGELSAWSGGHGAAEAAARVLSAGVAPIHGKAVANARRLARRRS